jgi:hypothetical protein
MQAGQFPAGPSLESVAPHWGHLVSSGITFLDPDHVITQYCAESF